METSLPYGPKGCQPQSGTSGTSCQPSSAPNSCNSGWQGPGQRLIPDFRVKPHLNICDLGDFSSVLMQRLKPTSYSPRYPRWMVGRPLLLASSALPSLGDAMFGYGQGVIAAIQVQPPFIKRFFGKTVTMDQIQAGETGVDPFVQGWSLDCVSCTFGLTWKRPAITVACLNLTAFVAAFISAYICDILGRRMSVRIGGIIYLIAALIQIFANDLGALIAGRSIQGLGVGILSMTVPSCNARSHLDMLEACSSASSTFA